MGKKIIGITVGTPISPQKIEEKINPVKTVNKLSPDENGDVSIPVPSELVEQLNKKAPAYTYGTDDLDAGTSPLETGKLHFVYE